MSLPIFDSGSTVGTDYAIPLTASHTVGSGSNRILIARCLVPTNSVNVTGVTYGGVAMTLLKKSTGNGVSNVYTYYLLNPASGTATISWSFSGNGRFSAIHSSWSNVDQTTPLTLLGEFVDGATNSHALSFTLGADSIALDFLGTSDVDHATLAQGSGQTLVGGVIQSGKSAYEAIASYASGVTSTSDSWADGFRQIGHVVLAINGVAGGGGTNNPPTFSGTIANITGTGGTAITPVDVHALFSDTDTLTYSASAAGTAWPSGLTINSTTGVISGTVATSTTTGLKVRATDTAPQTVDSNAFSVTISAPASTVTGVTVSPSTATVSGGAQQTFTASVAGTNSPSQTVNWSCSPAGSITSGVFTAPATTGSAQTITITATSAQDNTKSGTATVTVPSTSTSTSYVDLGTESCDNEQSGLLPAGTVLNAVVFRRDDLTVAKQVVTGITVGTGSVVPRFQVALAVGTPIHVVFIQASDNTQTGVVSNYATVA